MTVWRLMASFEKPDQQLEWSCDTGRIAVGWGKIGDLDKDRPADPPEISNRIEGISQ